MGNTRAFGGERGIPSGAVSHRLGWRACPRAAPGATPPAPRVQWPVPVPITGIEDAALMNAETAQCSLTPPRRAGRRSRPGAIFAACLALLLLAAAPAGARSLYFGAIVDGKPPTTESFLPGGAFHRFESQAGKGMSLVQWGQPWKMGGQMMDFQRHYFDNVRAHGSIPVLSWASHELGKGIHQPSFQLRDVYSGRYDAYLTMWAQDAKAWGHPFMLRF